ncbi:MAG: hypothetical protein IJZ83_07070 [Clostridia bacterium]|nr:hypothetical protein [Clostridia bacterium]
MKKRIITLILCTVLLISSCLSIASCSKPPEYSEVEERFIELIEASYEINKVLFGEGLPTYERVYDPRMSTKIYDNGGTRYYYYELNDEELGRIIAYRSSYLQPFKYAQVVKAPLADKTAIYENAEEKTYCYDIEYTEKTYDFYYSESDAENYDYVSDESKYKTIDSIKMAAEEVYSKDYLESSVYEALFTGVVMSEEEGASSLEGLSARYIEYMDSDSTVWLMQSNTYPPLVNETRIFDFSTAKVVKPGSKKLVNIEVETYLESSPDERITVRITMVLVDGEWYLDSGTY